METDNSDFHGSHNATEYAKPILTFSASNITHWWVDWVVFYDTKVICWRPTENQSSHVGRNCHEHFSKQLSLDWIGSGSNWAVKILLIYSEWTLSKKHVSHSIILWEWMARRQTIQSSSTRSQDNRYVIPSDNKHISISTLFHSLSLRFLFYDECESVEKIFNYPRLFFRAFASRWSRKDQLERTSRFQFLIFFRIINFYSPEEQNPFLRTMLIEKLRKLKRWCGGGFPMRLDALINLLLHAMLIMRFARLSRWGFKCFIRALSRLFENTTVDWLGVRVDSIECNQWTKFSQPQTNKRVC